MENWDWPIIILCTFAVVGFILVMRWAKQSAHRDEDSES